MTSYYRNKGSSKTLLPDLLKNGVNCELRKLHVGDLLWVAQEKVKPLPGTSIYLYFIIIIFFSFSEELLRMSIW